MYALRARSRVYINMRIAFNADKAVRRGRRRRRRPLINLIRKIYRDPPPSVTSLNVVYNIARVYILCVCVCVWMGMEKILVWKSWKAGATLNRSRRMSFCSENSDRGPAKKLNVYIDAPDAGDGDTVGVVSNESKVAAQLAYK